LSGSGKELHKQEKTFSGLLLATRIALSIGIAIFSKSRMNKLDLAMLIRSFVSGTSDPWEWDDFVSVPQCEPELEQIRKRLLALPNEYPPVKSGEYCNAEGTLLLLDIARSLALS